MTDRNIKVLNHLVETSKDGEKGFAKAAEDTKSEELKLLFRTRSRDCAQGASELQRLVQGLGGRPETDGSVAGALHRGWTELKSAIAQRTDAAILEECERGEEHARVQYSEALEEDLSPEIRPVVEAQYQGVLRNYDQIRDLRRRFASDN